MNYVFVYVCVYVCVCMYAALKSEDFLEYSHPALFCLIKKRSF